MHTLLRTCFASLTCLTLPVLAADMPGSGDHPGIPRVAGAEIIGYERSDYDAGTFLYEDEGKKVAVRGAEGARTRILYVAKEGDKPLLVQRNYEVALGELGAATDVYACRDKACNAHMLTTTLWSRDAMVPTEGLKHPLYLLGFSHAITSPSYRYMEVVTDEARYHVGVFATIIGDNNSNANVRGRTVALVEIVEIADFEATLEFVDADTMQTQIAETGHIALYGIQFEHDKSTLTPDSDATLAEIAKVMSANAGLRVYVVGHTDDVGALDYNQGLSLRRATTVVEALVQAGVEAGRLTPLGVGPAAPIGSNDTQEGRALNRRVELVKRAGS